MEEQIRLNEILAKALLELLWEEVDSIVKQGKVYSYPSILFLRMKAHMDHVLHPDGRRC